jgi:hypothetical protein
MAEDFGKLSPEQIKQLAGVISDAKSLTSQQAEIIERVLAGEADISNLRISSLQEYFDIYSRNLDLIARKHSALNDALLVLDGKLTKSYKKAISGDIPLDPDDEKAKAKKKKSAQTGKASNTKTEKSDEATETGTSNNGGSQNQKVTVKVKGQDTFDTLSTEARAALDAMDETEFSRRAEELSRFFQKTEEERRKVIVSKGAYLKAIEDHQQKDRIDQLKAHVKQVKKLEESIMDLEIIRYQTERDRQEQITDIRLTRIQESLDAENEAQQLINKISAELAYAGDSAEAFIQGEQDASQVDTSIKTGTGPEVFYETNEPKTNPIGVVPAETTSTGTLNFFDPIIRREVSRYEQKSTEVAVTRETETKKAGDIDTSDPFYAELSKLVSKSTGAKVTEAGEIRVKEVEAKDKLKAAKELQDSIEAYRAKKELEARRKNKGLLTKEAASEIEKEISKRFTIEKALDKKRIEERTKLEVAAARRVAEEATAHAIEELTSKGKTFTERKEAFRKLTRDESGDFDRGKAISSAIKTLSDAAQALEKKIDESASYKGVIDTRLQGSSNETKGGSYWDQITQDIIRIGAITPYYKQETFENNIETLVNRGIAFDLKQRAFLMTIQEKIANTFDVADGTLLRLIRIQQEDSTAGRLGMESALNTFLNSMYETSEYLSDVADNVRGSLEEMQALMQGAEAAEVEYQVQKWLGSLYSVGMSQSAVQSISDALGQIAAGQVDALTNGGAGNLLVMAANDAGLSIADMLTGGISSSQTNELLQATVNYLAELANSAEDNRVVQQQLAEVFGVKASDLRAATNLASQGSTQGIYGHNLSYNDMLAQLISMTGSMGSRTSIAEKMTNLWENGQHALAGSIANNPMTYFVYKMATLVDDATGGINIPFVSVMGSGVDINATVADLMRVGAMGAGILGSLGSIVSGLGSSFNGVSMLGKLGITSESGLAVTPRGTGAAGSVSVGAVSTSESGYVGNASGSDIKNATLQEAADTKKQQMIEAKESEEANQIDVLNTTVLKIYELLDDVANGDKSLRVKVDTYGLTKIASGSSSLAGINNLVNNIANSDSTFTSGYGVNSGVVSGNVSLGGWTSTMI